MYENSVREEYYRVTPSLYQGCPHCGKSGAKVQKKSELRKFCSTKSRTSADFVSIICKCQKKAVPLQPKDA